MNLPPIAKKKSGEFERGQVASDTERAMLGRPEKFGAAEPDDDEDQQQTIDAGLAPKPDDAKPEDAGAVTSTVSDGDKDTQIQQLQTENVDLKARLERIEQHLKLPPKDGAAAAEGNQPAADEAVDDYED